MWIFLNDAFLSVVECEGKPTHLLVRARFKGDIQNVFGRKVPVYLTPKADYRYRATISKAQVAEVLRKRVLEITYPNFKASVEDPERHDTYMDVWTTMVVAQEEKGHGGESDRGKHGKGAL